MVLKGNRLGERMDDHRITVADGMAFTLGILVILFIVYLLFTIIQFLILRIGTGNDNYNLVYFLALFFRIVRLGVLPF